MTSEDNGDPCSTIYEFILDHYNTQENRLEFTKEDFDVLQMQTNIPEEELKDYITNYNNWCDYEMPFLNYNGELPEEQITISNSDQTLKQGFSKFTSSLRKDSIYIIAITGGIILLVWVINR